MLSYLDHFELDNRHSKSELTVFYASSESELAVNYMSTSIS
jgi:hypothetical protein